MATERRYGYVGPAHLSGLKREGDCVNPAGVTDVMAWLRRQISGTRNSEVIATFVIDVREQLWLADRRSEHVACADGGSVLAAGEMTFGMAGLSCEVLEVTNLSTGFCPEPECWPVVCRVLDRIGLDHPDEWSHAFIFRRCEECQTIQLLKDDQWDCSVCGRELPSMWNFDDGSTGGA